MTYKIELTDQDLAVITQCLMPGPYQLVSPVIDSLKRQMQEIKNAESEKETPRITEPNEVSAGSGPAAS